MFSFSGKQGAPAGGGGGGEECPGGDELECLRFGHRTCHRLARSRNVSSESRNISKLYKDLKNLDVSLDS